MSKKNSKRKKGLLVRSYENSLIISTLDAAGARLHRAVSGKRQKPHLPRRHIVKGKSFLFKNKNRFRKARRKQRDRRCLPSRHKRDFMLTGT